MDVSAITFNERDEFLRKKIAEKIITLMRSKIELSPIVIDGSWGTGKTEFCHKLINLMSETETHHLIYIDAFKADHADEPLMTVVAEVINILPNEETKDAFVKKVLPAIRYGLKTIAKAGVAHILRQDISDVVEEFDKDIQQTADKAINASVESLLKDHVKANDNLKILQDALSSIAQEKPIIIFVDELDRCRPDFAVNMLETIKHTFDIDGVNFVLITNTQQLKASINHCYGLSVDAQRYLDKFLNFSFTLSSTFSINGHDKYDVSVEHYKALVEKSGILNELELLQDSSLSLVEHLIIQNGYSLREIETLVRHLEIYQILTEEKGLAKSVIWGFKLIRLVGVILFSLMPDLARNIQLERADTSELALFFGQDKIPPFDGNHPYPDHYQVLAVMLGQECSLNSSVFTPEDEDVPGWEDLIRQYFGRGGFPPERGERSKIVQKVINVLSLDKA